ncbi:MAG: MmgE/PrpD family protein [Deltaproteobacteria bacterium]|nr:MmgE/PrpD family protein [Deltaproteobacteria bacterium]
MNNKQPAKKHYGDVNMDASYRLAKNLVKLGYHDLPAETIEIAKKDILDTLGVAIAGSSESGGKELMTLVGEWGGKEESTVIMFGMKVPAPFAALVNGTTAHSLDYDDVILSTGHVGVSIIPAAFSIAERKGNVNGKDLITAVVLGIDVECRLGEASKPLALGPGWLYTPLYGVFGAASVAGKLLNLDEDQMVNAFGIAYSHAAGTRQPIVDGALSKRMAAGLASQAGVFSALAASKGITGAKNCFEGKFGLFNVYHRGEYDNKTLLADLGKYFPIVNLGFKVFPACSATETAIEATLALVKEHKIRPEDVEQIIVHASEYSRNVCEPLEIKQNPRVTVDAQFSIPWVVATALMKGKVTIENFTAEAIKDPIILDVARKVIPRVDAEVRGKDIFPAIVEIKMKASDTVYSRREDVATGHPDKPLSWDDLASKFRDCATHGRKPLPDQKIEYIIQAIHELGNVDDVAEIIGLMG